MRNKNLTTFVMIAALAAVLLRALVPTGYMPELNTHKAFQLVICTADGAHNVVADDAYNPFAKIPAAKHKTDKPCDFSVNGFNGKAVIAQAFVLMLMAFAAAFLTSRKEFFLSRRRYVVASPRAPPIAV